MLGTCGNARVGTGSFATSSWYTFILFIVFVFDGRAEFGVFGDLSLQKGHVVWVDLAFVKVHSAVNGVDDHRKWTTVSGIHLELS